MGICLYIAFIHFDLINSTSADERPKNVSWISRSGSSSVYSLLNFAVRDWAVSALIKQSEDWPKNQADSVNKTKTDAIHGRLWHLNVYERWVHITQVGYLTD